MSRHAVYLGAVHHAWGVQIVTQPDSLWLKSMQLEKRLEVGLRSSTLLNRYTHMSMQQNAYFFMYFMYHVKSYVQRLHLQHLQHQCVIENSRLTTSTVSVVPQSLQCSIFRPLDYMKTLLFPYFSSYFLSSP